MSNAAWLQKHTKKVLFDTTLLVTGHKAMSCDDVPIQLSVKAIELDYGPCIWWDARVDIPCEIGWSWDDHPLLHVRARSEKNRTTPVSSAGEIIDDTPALRALLAELCEPPKQRTFYTDTDCTHRARLIAALELFWS